MNEARRQLGLIALELNREAATKHAEGMAITKVVALLEMLVDSATDEEIADVLPQLLAAKDAGGELDLSGIVMSVGGKA